MTILLQVTHFLVLITYTVTLVEPRGLSEPPSMSASKSAENADRTEITRHIRSRSWENMRRKLLGDHRIPLLNVLQERTSEHLSRRNARSVALTPSNIRTHQLLSCKLQHFNLAIMDDGTVIGLKNQSSPYGMLINNTNFSMHEGERRYHAQRRYHTSHVVQMLQI